MDGAAERICSVKQTLDMMNDAGIGLPPLILKIQG